MTVAAGTVGSVRAPIKFCFQHSLATKVNLMYLVKGDEKFNVQLCADPQNTSSKHVLVSTAWIGLKSGVPDEGTKPFLDFLDAHGIASMDSFKAIVSGNSAPKPFFPLPAETQLARVSYLYEPKDPNRLGIASGSLYGILKIYQGSQEKKDAIFERNSVYLWGMCMYVLTVVHLPEYPCFFSHPFCFRC